MNTKRYLGIDPGSQVTGWGIIEEQSGVLALVACGAICPPKGEFTERLTFIYHQLSEIVQEHKPSEAAIEQIFLAKNALSALKLGQARGIAMAACIQNNVPLFDYAATMVKQSIVGNGRAEKTQVAFMVHTLLGIKNPLQTKMKLDTTDALAVALCHANQKRFNARIKNNNP